MKTGISPERFRKIRQMLLHRQPDLTVVMDNVNKAHNLSAIIRSCDSVGICEIHAVSYRKTIYTEQNAAAGASKWSTLNLYTDIEMVYSKLSADGMQIIVATNSEGCIDFRNIDYTAPTALVVGAEWDGISKEAIMGAAHAITVPMLGMIESLNVSVATAVILFEAQRQRALKGMYLVPQLAPACFERLLFEFSYPKLSRELTLQGDPYPMLDELGGIMH
ncbi:MAG: tRNA (guanosine(18)-2'-O)-methyltransferase TrmH [Chlorobiaceae bacterium]